MEVTKLFKSLKKGEKFIVYGDVHLNYNFPKICECFKIDDNTGKEINGIHFAMNHNDEVSVVM